MSGIFEALRKRYAPPSWAYFEEVRNGTGYARKTTRTADGLALSLWPSRGLELHGIEVKVHRSDWLRELDEPEKAEEIGRFCDRWWLACTPGVVADLAEVPIAWGLLEWDGKRWKSKREAPKREPEPLDRLMLASLLRQASESQHRKLDELSRRIAADMNKAEVESAKKQRDDATAWVESERENTRRLRGLIHQVEQLIGEPLTDSSFMPGAKLTPGLSESVVTKLSAVRNVDVEQAKRHAQDALRCLRVASAQARLALRSAGVRTQKARGYRG